MLLNQETKGIGALISIDSQGYGTFLLVGKDGVCSEISSEVRTSSLTIGESYVVHFEGREDSEGCFVFVVTRASLLKEGPCKSRVKIAVKHEILNRIQGVLDMREWLV